MNKRWLNDCVVQKILRGEWETDIIVRCNNLEPFRVFDPDYDPNGLIRYREGDRVLVKLISYSEINRIYTESKSAEYSSRNPLWRAVVKAKGQLAATREDLGVTDNDDDVVDCGVFVYAYDRQRQKSIVGEYVEFGAITQCKVVRKLDAMKELERNRET